MSASRAAARALRQELESLRGLGVTAVPKAAPDAPANGGDVPTVSADADGKAARLAQLAREAQGCRRCPLYQGATQAVLSDGTPDAKLVFVGEGPGQDEDRQGVPFVGRAGQLLTKMITAMGLRREDVYICNVVKHRPPGNRTPLPEEMDACFPLLREQLAIVRPRVICALGSTAVKALLCPYTSITKARGSVREYDGIPVVPTFHPAYLLRNPAAKKDAWDDLKKVKQLLAQSE